VSALKEVRSFLLKFQHQFAKEKDAVFEGRDLGTVVFPKAEIKIFLTAEPRVRAERRLLEIIEKYPEEAQKLTREQLLEDLMRRDAYDSTREIAPLRCPEDALQIDTTHLSIDQVVDQIVKFSARKKTTMKPAWARKIPLSWLYRLVLFLAWCFFKLFYRHKVYGLEHFYPDAAIIAGNHTSYYDPPILAISWPQEVHFLAREGLFKIPLFGGLIRKLNAHPVAGGAGDIAVFKLIGNLLTEGKKIILFPEGKRSDTDHLDVLKPGLAMLVARSKSAIIPAYIHGTFSIWNRFYPLPKLWGRTACVYGTPILWSDFAHLEKREAQKAIMDKLAASITTLREWYEKGAKGIPP
jgi:1-acyl-sn-glycerol-3-phosphate acyltransferase